jgi:hypothetical protein
MPHNKEKLKISECDQEWLEKQNLPEKCRCSRKGIWVLIVDSFGFAHLSDKRKRTVGPFCNKCVKREFESS